MLEKKGKLLPRFKLGKHRSFKLIKLSSQEMRYENARRYTIESLSCPWKKMIQDFNEKS